MQILKNNKSTFTFGTISKFYCRIFVREHKDLVLISDFKHFFLSNKHDFCNFCFSYDYLNYIAKQELVGIFTKQEISSTTIDGFLTKEIYKSLNRILKKEINFKEKTWVVFDLVENTKKSFLENTHPICSKCYKDKIIELNTNNINRIANSKTKFLKTFFKNFNSTKTSKNINTKMIKRYLASFESLISYSDTFELNDLGFKHYFSSILSTIPNEDNQTNPTLCVGQDKNKKIAKVKALMEFVERYALKNKIILPYAISRSNLDISNQTSKLKILDEVKDETKVSLAIAIDMLKQDSTLIKIGNEKLDYIKSSNGMAAHFNLKDATINSLLELIERDAFARWWVEPENFIAIKPQKRETVLINNFKKFACEKIQNDSLEIKVILLPSPLNVPVVLALLTSKNHNLPPALMVGGSAEFDINKAIKKSILELYGNFLNICCRYQNEPTFFKENSDLNIELSQIKAPSDHGSFYHNPALIKELEFLNLIIYAKEKGFSHKSLNHSFDELKSTMLQKQIDWYVLDMTPKNFLKAGIFVTKSIVPSLNELVFGHGSIEYFKNQKLSKFSLARRFPHCFS